MRVVLIFLFSFSLLLQAKHSSKKEWNYIFNKLDLWTLPISGTMAYLGHLNYYTRKDYTAQEIISTQNAKTLQFYFNNRPLADFARFYTYGLGGAAMVAAGPLVNWNTKKLGTIGIMYTQLLLMERGLYGIVSNVTRVPRPFVYDPTVSLEYKQERGKDAFMYFYSSRASFAFANAFFWHDMIKHSDWNAKWRIYGTAFLYGSASAISLMEVFSGEHYIQDVILGAAAGSTLAYAILKLHDIYDMEPYIDLPEEVNIVPTGNGIYLSYNF